jgi:uncharacterized protein YndB with AHSA1/START domain
MPATSTEQQVQSFQFTRDETINAPAEIIFQAILDEIGPQNQMPDGKPFALALEAWPGGRWFRDLGNKTGHLWGHVQVIKPPTLLEISGPMMMSYAAVNHIQYKLTAQGDSTLLKFTHTAVGLIIPQHRDGMPEGWGHWLKRIRETAERRATK